MIAVATDNFYVFGLSWWPFDGAVTAALIALVGTGASIWFNRRRFNTAESNQTDRHNQTIASTEQMNAREQLLIDLRRAEDALATDDERKWVYAGVTLQQVGKNEHATSDDKRRARAIIKGYTVRVRSPGGRAE